MGKFVVLNVSGAAIKVQISNTTGGNGSWFPIEQGEQESWKSRSSWETVAVEFQDGDRRGFYTLPDKNVIVHGKDDIRY